MIKYLFFLTVIIVALSGYEPIKAHTLAVMSKIAYDSVDDINWWKCPLCSTIKLVDVKAYVDSKSTQGFIGFLEEQNAIIVAFRGTTDVINWITNLDFGRISYSGCMGCSIHPGFWNAYLSVATIVRVQTQFLLSKYRGSKIYVTGHSLGGALAQIAALDLKLFYGHVDGLYTFGQPRIGNDKLALFSQTQIVQFYRLIHYADLVPHIPPLNFGFLHGAYEMWYQQNMQTFWICFPEASYCSNSIPATQLNTNDHDMNFYLMVVGAKKTFAKISSLMKK